VQSESLTSIDMIDMHFQPLFVVIYWQLSSESKATGVLDAGTDNG